MKKVMTSCLLFAFAGAFAQQKSSQTVSGVLNSATVFYGYGAELHHSTKATLVAGLQELVISNVATQPDANTIQVGCPESVVLMSYKFITKVENAAPNTIVKKMTDSIDVLQKQVAAINNEYAIEEDVLNRTSKLIESNIGNTPKKEISSADLIKLLEYYTARVETIKTRLYTLQLKRNDVQEQINGINTRMSEIQTTAGAASKMVGQVVLQLMTRSAMTADISISYFTRNAGWLPTYDMRMQTLDNSFKLTYKASVTQSTGIDWKNVKLNLSTSNPNLGSKMPILNPLYVNLYAPVLYNQVSQVGATYRSMKQSMAASTQQVQATDEGFAIHDEKKEEPATVSAFTSYTESQLNVNFEIDLPYDIPADGKAYSVFIKDEQLKAGYQHYTIPKLDRDAFLVAELMDWQKLDLLPGEANIIMDNIYLGKSAIDPNTTSDTLPLSLGRDKRVAVTRTLIKEFSTSKVKGDVKTETFTYEVIIRNNKKQAIDLSVQDQYPISKIKEVEVTLDDKGGADVNAETGLLKWALHLQPGETKKLRFSYSLKYPKDKVLQNQR